MNLEIFYLRAFDVYSLSLPLWRGKARAGNKVLIDDDNL